VRVLIAPDKFKDALDAEVVAAALAAGVRDARPDAEIECCPLADGGEGTGRILARALGAEERCAGVLDPLGHERRAQWWLRAAQRLAIVEMAEASGLALLQAGERDALRTSSYGTGQLLRAAADAGCTHVLLCVGGSATVDGGAGCLQALGWQFVDMAGAPLSGRMCGGALIDAGSIRPPAARLALSIDILCDVDNPLLGPRGAAPVFGPQKGASAAGVEELERGLALWADVLEHSCGCDVRALPAGGAAGGIAAGLVAACGARLRPGFDEVALHVDLRGKLAGCELCLTGEGRIDDQTAGGKAVAGVARLAGQAGVDTIALAGAVRLRKGQTIDDLARAVGVRRIVLITPAGIPLEAALAATATNLRCAAREAVGHK
jgi:glycerate kinase